MLSKQETPRTKVAQSPQITAVITGTALNVMALEQLILDAIESEGKNYTDPNVAFFKKVQHALRLAINTNDRHVQMQGVRE